MKSSWALAIEQLLLLDAVAELHFGIARSFAALSLVPILPSVVPVPAGALVVDAVVVVAVVSDVVTLAERVVLGGGVNFRGVNNALNGTSGIGKSSSFSTTVLFATNAPIFIVSLRDFERSSLKWADRNLFRLFVCAFFVINTIQDEQQHELVLSFWLIFFLKG